MSLCFSTFEIRSQHTQKSVDYNELDRLICEKFDLKYSNEDYGRNHPIKYNITNITKAAIPIVGYAAFVIYSHYFFHLCGSSCNSSSYVAFCIYGILAITSFR